MCEIADHRQEIMALLAAVTADNADPRISPAALERLLAEALYEHWAGSCPDACIERRVAEFLNSHERVKTDDGGTQDAFA